MDTSEPVELVWQVFKKQYGTVDGASLVRAPGRVNLIGEHTDYNDGFVLPMTLGQAVYFAIRSRSDRRIRVFASNFDENLDISLDDLPGKGTSWKQYVGGVIQSLLDRGIELSGLDGVLYGNVPVASGLSSSAAIEVATLTALQELFGFEMDGVAAAELCQQVEHRFIGVQCGIMDQFASRLGRAGHALFLDCRTLEYESVPIALADYCLVIADSRASRSLAGSKYNERRTECEAGVAHLRQYDPGILALRDVSQEMLMTHIGEMPEVVGKRCRHVVFENARVLDAVAALRVNDLVRFGKLMTESHESLRDLYEVSSAELNTLVEIALGCNGVLGSRMTGAGFGGCTVTLIRRDSVEELKQLLIAGYENTFNRKPNIYIVEENLEAGTVPA